MDIPEQFEQWSEELDNDLYERKEAVKIVLLAALAFHNYNKWSEIK